MGKALTIIVSGMIAADPQQGGAAWAVLQYVLGLMELGHEVYLVEPVAEKSLRPRGAAPVESVNAAYFRRVMADFDLAGRCTLLLAGTRQTVGISYKELRAIARRTDLLLNISGMLTDPALLEVIPRRVYLDLDPAFIQLWHAVGKIDMRFDPHTHFVTIGQLLDSPASAIPLCGRKWLKTWQPIVLSRWPVRTEVTRHGLTTIGNWRGYGSIEHGGVAYGQKAHSLRRFFELPTRTPVKFELALAIDSAEKKDLAGLAENRWELLNPAEVAGSPGEYQRFIQRSWGEFGIAKSGYVAARCGWFSDRSLCYLASGRPVVAQDTGFAELLPTGEGLFAFSTVEQALAAIHSLSADYPRHSAAARRIAERFFDSRVVLPRLLDLVGAAA